MTNFAAAGVSFFSTEDAEIAKADALDRNAKVADFNAETTRQQGVAADQALARDISATQGRMTAAYAGSGVQMTGSPSDVLADSIRQGVLDRATNKWNYTMKQMGYTNEAAADRLDARNVRHAAIVKAVSAGLASFNGGNGGTGGLGESGSSRVQSFDTSTNWSGGNSLTGGTYTGTGSTSTMWASGNDLGWGSNSSGWGS